MSSPANVQSLEAIDVAKNALIKFKDQVADALTEIDAEMRRVLEWLEHDRPRFWKTQYRIATDRVHEAQQALHRCLMFPVADERPSCYEERTELRKAQARQRYCEEKSELVRKWHGTVQHELFEYQGRISQLERLIEIDVPQAIGVLNKIVRHLEDYQSVRPAPGQSAASSLAAKLWPEDEVNEEAAASTESVPDRESHEE